MSSNPSSLQAFFAELKRRRVFRVMAVYGAVAFVVLQVADLAIGPLGLPEWTMTFILFFRPGRRPDRNRPRMGIRGRSAVAALDA